MALIELVRNLSRRAEGECQEGCSGEESSSQEGGQDGHCSYCARGRASG